MEGGVKGQSFYSELSTPIYYQVAGFWVMNTPQGIGWYKMAQNIVPRVRVVTISQLFLREISTTQPAQETVTDNCRHDFMNWNFFGGNLYVQWKILLALPFFKLLDIYREQLLYHLDSSEKSCRHVMLYLTFNENNFIIIWIL